MKRMVLVSIMLAAALSLFGQEGKRTQVDMFGWIPWNGTGSALNIAPAGMGIRISGKASSVAGGGAGYVLESTGDIGFDGKNKIIIKISGITDDRFDSFKLFKLEINGKTLSTTSDGMVNRNDNTFVNARNGECSFTISGQRIRKIGLIFFNCEVKGINFEMFVE
jgi:hypothetical protein